MLYQLQWQNRSNLKNTEFVAQHDDVDALWEIECCETLADFKELFDAE